MKASTSQYRAERAFKRRPRPAIKKPSKGVEFMTKIPNAIPKNPQYAPKTIALISKKRLNAIHRGTKLSNIGEGLVRLR